MKLADKLVALRRTYNITQQELAKIAGVTDKAVSAWEQGTRSPKMKSVMAICDRYRLNLKAFVDETNDEFAPAAEILPDNVIPYIPAGRVPLVGEIACGEPILAEQNIVDYVDVPGHIKADYALTCHGESMINLGIRDGDIAYIRQQEIVNNGQIAAVIIDDEEATLKRFHYDGNTLVLIPANDDLDPRVFVGEAMNRVRVLGLAVGFTHVFNNE